MVQRGFILSAVLVITVFVNNSDALLKCWRCSSDATNGQFCADPFDQEIITDQQRYWSYVNCTYAYGVKTPTTRPACKKLVQEIYGKIVVSRSCFYEDVSDATDKCSRDNYPSYIRTLHCSTCTTDGCNGASGFEPVMVMIFIAALTKLFIF
ncbi:hypothetical protein ACFFRR_004918 [Megaselia abdita]